MKIFLQTRWAANENLEIVIQRFPFVIGRRSDSDCALPLPFVSRRHCQFTRSGQHVLVQDLESYNGTYVNGIRLTSPLPISQGDQLSIGPCAFRVMVVHDTGETPALSPALSTSESPAVKNSLTDDLSTM